MPDWTRGRRSVFLQVDHIIELQVTPASMRGIFDDVDNYELLDQTSNVASRNRLVGNIDRERAIQGAAVASIWPAERLRKKERICLRRPGGSRRCSPRRAS